MKTLPLLHNCQKIKKLHTVILLALSTLIFSPTVYAQTTTVDIAQTPLFLSKNVDPRVMLTLSVDHELFKKAYTDYTDLTGNGVLETTYTDSYDYSGYFNSNTCYQHSSGRFIPASIASGQNGHDCSGNYWSGNFLNWATMTRMDIVRHVLYGGLRHADPEISTSPTILERAHLPRDVHSYAKVFAPGSGSEVNRFTPYNDTAISMCNVSWETTGVSGTSSAVPSMRVAKGEWRVWASSEVVQCGWRDQAYVTVAEPWHPPENTHKLDDLIVRVEVCNGSLNEENCRLYPNGNYKPTGLIQEFSEGRDQKVFRLGLMTGSYDKNRAGGVLRRNLERIVSNTDNSKNEINLETGQFINQGDNDTGIIQSLNRFRIARYNYANNRYDGNNDWGNPLSEIKLEVLRYFSGKTSPTTAFLANDTTYISGLNSVSSWADPLTSNTSGVEWCAPLKNIIISTGLNSYDTDHLSNDLSLNVNNLTNSFANEEGISGSYFIGENGTSNDKQCTAKNITSLSNAKGICPEVPSLEGGYHIAGISRYAARNDIRPGMINNQYLETFGVAIAEAMPRFEIPFADGKKIALLPACSGGSNTRAAGPNNTQCSLTDLWIDQPFIYDDIGLKEGSFIASWEDQPMASDYDMDGASRIHFKRENNSLKITVEAVQSFTGANMWFGYTIAGSTNDGIHLSIYVPRFNLNRGGQGFSYILDPPVLPLPKDWDDPNTQNFTPSSSSSIDYLETPLWYASRYGQLLDEDGNLPDLDVNGKPGNFFNARNPALLKEALRNIFLDIKDDASSATAIASNSTFLETESLLYQASFNSIDWSGDLIAYKPVVENNTLSLTAEWSAATQLNSRLDDRNIITHNGTGNGINKGIEFSWDAIKDHSSLKSLLKPDATDAELQNIINFTKGEAIEGFRTRDSILGDIINSSPVFSHREHFGYHTLGGTGSQSYNEYVLTTKTQQQKMIYVGSNSGMLHAFNADTGEEVFAYIPSNIYSNLANLTDINYQHQYYVDGNIHISDAYIDGSWRTILLGTTGRGGKSVFALDITNPTSVDETNVLWEFTHEELGYTLGKPVIGRLKNGTWAAVFGNGYGSSSHKSELFLVNLATGTLIRKIDTGKGSATTKNGLSEPSYLNISDGNNLYMGTIYAGDLLGNMWKFDLTANNSGNWDVAYTQGPNKHPLFTAYNSSNQAQPITVRPEIRRHPSGGYMILFGTGKYFSLTDPADMAVQSIYGIRDTGTRITQTDRSTLQQQTIIYRGNVTGFVYPVTAVSNNPVNYSDTGTQQRGWYMDLIYPAGLANAIGERVITNPRVWFDRLRISTTIPGNDPCSPAATSWNFELDLMTGGRLSYNVFDMNADGSIDSGDSIVIGDENIPVSAFGQDGVGNLPTQIGDFIAVDTDDETADPNIGYLSGLKRIDGRQTWREVR